jgi:hypothetical protein
MVSPVSTLLFSKPANIQNIHHSSCVHPPSMHHPEPEPHRVAGESRSRQEAQDNVEEAHMPNESQDVVSGKEMVLNNNCSEHTLDWLRGSTNIGAACRSVWIVDTPNPTKLSERWLTLIKTASGPTRQNMAFVMKNPQHGRHFINKVPESEPCFQKGKMENWLIETLQKNKPITKKELHEQAAGTGFSHSSIDKVMTSLHSTKQIHKVSQGKRTYWKLSSLEKEK